MFIVYDTFNQRSNARPSWLLFDQIPHYLGLSSGQMPGGCPNLRSGVFHRSGSREGGHDLRLGLPGGMISLGILTDT